MNNQNIEDKALTTLAFVIGLALIDNLSSTEQNAVGNWIMLIAQTLCTNGSYTFNKEWKGHTSNGNTPVAFGSNVPVCPIFSFNIFLAFLTTS